MTNAKKFFQDRTILLLTAINSFLVVISTTSIILRLGVSTHSQGLIGEYRQNLGLSAFKPGNTLTFVSFIVFLVLVLLFHISLAHRMYHIRRHFALTVMGLGTLLIILATVVSNSLLML